MITNVLDFVEFIKTELDWNEPKVQLADNLPAYQELFKEPIDQMFIYTCLPGSSIKPELRAAIKEFGYKGKVQIVSACNTRRDFRHGYYIGFKKSSK